MPEFCHVCSKWFKNILAHYRNAAVHRNSCAECREDFDDEKDLQDHDIEEHGLCTFCGEFQQTRGNLIRHQTSEHPYCQECKRHFVDPNALRMHLASKRHKSANVTCPGCTRSFVSVGALTIHLESGSCASGVNNKHVEQRMREIDLNNVITRPLITSGYDSDDGVETWATVASYNQHRGCFECPLMSCRRDFQTLQAVNQHLQSPYHAQKNYRCPNKGCGGFVFARLSALVQHIESNKCGVGQWRQVKTVLRAVQDRGLLM